MSASAILSCVTNWAVSFSTGILSLGALWRLNGYFQAMGWAPGSRLLSNWFGKHERGKVFGCYVFAAGMASVLSFVTSILIVHIWQLDWRWIFRLPVLLMLLGGITFFLVARERPEYLGFQSPHDDEADDPGRIIEKELLGSVQRRPVELAPAARRAGDRLSERRPIWLAGLGACTFP